MRTFAVLQSGDMWVVIHDPEINHLAAQDINCSGQHETFCAFAIDFDEPDVPHFLVPQHIIETFCRDELPPRAQFPVLIETACAGIGGWPEIELGLTVAIR